MHKEITPSCKALNSWTYFHDHIRPNVLLNPMFIIPESNNEISLAPNLLSS